MFPSENVGQDAILSHKFHRFRASQRGMIDPSISIPKYSRRPVSMGATLLREGYYFEEQSRDESVR